MGDNIWPSEAEQHQKAIDGYKNLAARLSEQIAALQQQYKLKCQLMDEAHILIAKLEKEIASLQAQRRKDVEDAINFMYAHTEFVDKEMIDGWNKIKAQYLTKYDQTKNEGV